MKWILIFFLSASLLMPASAKSIQELEKELSSVRLFSVGFNGFVAKRMPEEMIYEKCLMSNQALSIFEAVMENEHSTPEGRAYAACGLWEKKEADKIKLKQEYNELSVTVLIGDMLRKEPLGNIVRNIILNGCN